MAKCHPHEPRLELGAVKGAALPRGHCHAPGAPGSGLRVDVAGQRRGWEGWTSVLSLGRVYVCRVLRGSLNVKACNAICFTAPYISIATNHLCISAIKELNKPINNQHYLVVDVSLTQLIEFVMGDTARATMSPYFKAGYGIIVACLFSLVLFLLNIVFIDIYELITHVNSSSDPLEPFSIIIYITLALAVFDLGKTILEEEILMHKDIFRHSSTRRTITRFISTVLIAISIEALLTMFKAALGQSEYLMPAIAMMLAVVGLLIALAIYVYLGAKAETLLTQARVKLKSSE